MAITVVLFCGDDTEKQVIQTPQDIHQCVQELFGLDDKQYLLKIYDSEVDEFINLRKLESVKDKSKIKVIARQTDNADSSLQKGENVVPGAAAQEEMPCTSSVGDGTSHQKETVCVQNRQKVWHGQSYRIPSNRFSARLRQALQGKELPANATRELIDILADDLYSFTPYPTLVQRETCAKALVNEHIVLKEVIGSGYDGLVHKLDNKLKKIRMDLAKEKNELKVNVVGHSLTGKRPAGPGKRAKTPKKGILNWAPDHELGEDEATVGRHQKWMCSEMKKSPQNRDKGKIEKLMEITFSFRRGYINNNPRLIELKEQYPALFVQSELYNEFKRLMSIDIRRKVLDRLLEITSVIQSICTEKKKQPEKMKMYITNMKMALEGKNLQESALIQCETSIMLLPLVLGELEEKLVSIMPQGTAIEEVAKDAVEPKIVVVGDIHDAEAVYCVGESTILFRADGLLEGMSAVFAVYYACNIEYPQALQGTFLFYQSYIMKIEDGRRSLPMKVLSLAEKIKRKA